MNFTIRAVKDGDTTVLVRAGPTLAVAKARALSKTGWIVEIIDADGVSYPASKFDQLLSFDRPRASQMKSRDNVLDVVSDILKKRFE
ncbi:hypothetical protein [Bradyrhizobium sp. AZCC 1693]|uniref:hypothetical protein n=1 Tax=Bradyrhizobium sp. AZCC 1693 TaxID=3117029 RepID=UPI002FF0D412